MENSFGSSVQDEVVHVDGSFGEGGGQIIRNSVTLAILLRKKLEVVKIRAGRPNPGLASQHLESILAMLRLSGAHSTTRFGKGITEFNIDARAVARPGAGVEKTEVDLKTAGSINLCIQCLLPYLLSLKSPSRILVIGGTHVMKAPNADYMGRVFLPTMQNVLGYDLSIQMLRPGYFPRGGGRVDVRVNPSQRFKSFNLTQRGKLLERFAILNRSSNGTVDAQQCIKRMEQVDKGKVEVRHVSYGSIEYFLRYERASAGFYYLIPTARKVTETHEEMLAAIERVEAEVTEFLNTPSAVVDSFMQDQLIIYMALAKLDCPNEVSQFRTLSPLTDHTLSAIHVAEKFTGLKFNVEEEKHELGINTFLISL